jgi:hypothetical protein
MGAAILSVPELNLEPSEAKPLAAAIARVAAFYPQEINPKLLAWFNLSAVAGGLYAPRWFALRNRLRREALPRVVAAPTPKPQAEHRGFNGAPPLPTDGQLLDPSVLGMGPPTD